MKKHTLLIITLSVLILSGLIWKGFLLPKAHAPAYQPEEAVIPVQQEEVSKEKDISISSAVITDRTVVASLSNGETKVIAKYIFKDDVDEFLLIESYTKAVISPNGQFVALDGKELEDEFVQIYNLAADTLEKKIYGTSNGWSSDGLLNVSVCSNGCREYVSVSASTPWVVEEK